MVNVSVRYYRRKNKLREKTIGLGKVKTEDITFDEEAMAAAIEALNEMAEDYPDWVSSLIESLSEQHRRCVDSPDQRKGYFEKINSIAHDMRGQGGTFGYQLISDFADALYFLTHSQAGMSDNHVEIIKAHIDAMRVVIKNRINGDGGDVGKELQKGLEAAIKKYSKRK